MVRGVKDTVVGIRGLYGEEYGESTGKKTVWWGLGFENWEMVWGITLAVRYYNRKTAPLPSDSRNRIGIPGSKSVERILFPCPGARPNSLILRQLCFYLT